jgi:hypothetical protein
MHAVDRSELQRVLSALLEDPHAVLVDADLNRLPAGAGQGLGVYRVSGQARTRGRRVPWSVILKVLPARSRQPPDGWCYAQREVFAYRSGLVGDLPGGLTAPRCVSLSRHERGRHFLWLQDLGANDHEWSLETYGRAARCLGRFNGAYLAGHPIPHRPWLSRNWLRSWLVETTAAIAALSEHREHPLVRRVYPRDVAAGIARLWAEREALLQALDHLPETLCHHDAFRRNLVACEDRIAALDWAFLGRGAIGAELSPLVSATLAFREVAVDAARELEQVTMASYLAGLREVGWRGPAEEIWFGYGVTSALRYGPGTVRLVLPALLDPARRDEVVAVLGIPFDAVMDHWAAVIRYHVELR